MSETSVAHNDPSVVILIPAYNEVQTIGNLIRDIKARTGYDVVVIDDLSTDGTVTAARNAGAIVLPHTLRSGAWCAIRTGFRYAAKYGYNIAVTMDGDGQHPPVYIQSLIEPVASNRTDVAIGSCTCRASTARKIAWKFFRNFSMLKINDLTSGFRAYSQDAVRSLLSVSTSLYDYQDIGVLLDLNRQGFKISEISIEMCKRISGHSRIFSSWFAVFKYLMVTWVLCLSKFK